MTAQPNEMQLAANALYRVPDASLVRLTCAEGVLWITLDNDPRDVVLEAGGEFTTTDRRRALVFALKPSRFYLAPNERSEPAPVAKRARYSRKTTMEMFSRFHPMPFRKAAR